MDGAIVTALLSKYQVLFIDRPTHVGQVVLPICHLLGISALRQTP